MFVVPKRQIQEILDEDDIYPDINVLQRKRKHVPEKVVLLINPNGYLVENCNKTLCKIRGTVKASRYKFS